MPQLPCKNILLGIYQHIDEFENHTLLISVLKALRCCSTLYLMVHHSMPGAAVVLAAIAAATSSVNNRKNGYGAGI